MNGIWHVAISTVACFLLWNKEGNRLLFHIKTEDPNNFFSCSTKCVAESNAYFIVTADCEGNLYSICCNKSVYFDEKIGKVEKGFPCSMASDEKNFLLIIGLNFGNLIIYHAKSPNSIQKMKEVEVFQNVSFPINCLEVLFGGPNLKLAIVGLPNGCLIGYDLPNLNKRFSMQGHARSITGLTIHPTRCVFASVSEDTYLNIYEISENNKKIDISIIKSLKVENGQLTGVVFLPPTFCSIAAVSYDLKNINVWNNVI